MSITTNYALIKPEGTDIVNIQNFNDNADIIDTKLKEVNTSFSELTQDRIYYCGATSGTNTYTITNSEITAYTDGLTVRVKIGIASTGASTLNINGLGAKTILDSLGNAIASGGLKAGLPYQLCYNGTNFIVLGKGGGGTATASQILLGATATTDTGQVTGNIPSKTAQTYTPTTVNQTIAAGQYINEIQTILGDADLVTANIKAGANIFGVAGDSAVVDTSSGTLTNNGTAGSTNQVLSGYKCYSDGVLYTGAMANYSTADQVADAITPNGTTLKLGIPNTGYYSDTYSITATDADFIASNIVSTANIFGLQGTATPTTLGGYSVGDIIPPENLQTTITKVWDVTTTLSSRLLDIDASGNIYFVDSISLRKYNSSGTLLWTYSGMTMPEDYSLTVDSSGNAYCSGWSSSTTKIYKISTSGTLVWSKTLTAGSAPMVGVSPSGYIAYGDENSGIVYVCNAAGTIVSNFAATLTISSSRLLMDSSNNVYVCDNSAVKKYSSTGTLLWSVSTSFQWMANLDSSGNLYYAASTTGYPITKKNAGGTTVWTSVLTNGYYNNMWQLKPCALGVYFVRPNDYAIGKLTNQGTIAWDYSGGIDSFRAAVDDGVNVYCLTSTTLRKIKEEYKVIA